MKSFHNHKGILLSLIHVNQLLTDRGTKFLTWSQLKSYFNISLRRRNPLFYTALQRKLTSDNSYNIEKTLRPSLCSLLAIYPTINLLPLSTDGRKKEWILTQ
jgi:hypothetical protein